MRHDPERRELVLFRLPDFPCARLRQLDKRYRTKYGMSMTENLLRIQEIGLEAFVAAEKLKWACPECGSLLCVHLPDCGVCGRSRNPSAPADEGRVPERSAGARPRKRGDGRPLMRHALRPA